MNWKKVSQDKISLAMFQNDVSKVELAEHLDLSYPTMLTKLKDIGTFKLSEFDKVCSYLQLNINDLIPDKWLIETFGSALKGNTFKDGTTNSWYVMEMAEKRAMSRAVLKLAGFYELGVFGEDESESFKKNNN